MKFSFWWVHSDQILTESWNFTAEWYWIFLTMQSRSQRSEYFWGQRTVPFLSSLVVVWYCLFRFFQVLFFCFFAILTESKDSVGDEFVRRRILIECLLWLCIYRVWLCILSTLKLHRSQAVRLIVIMKDTAILDPFPIILLECAGVFLCLEDSPWPFGQKTKWKWWNSGVERLTLVPFVSDENRPWESWYILKFCKFFVICPDRPEYR